MWCLFDLFCFVYLFIYFRTNRSNSSNNSSNSSNSSNDSSSSSNSHDSHDSENENENRNRKKKKRKKEKENEENEENDGEEEIKTDDTGVILGDAIIGTTRRRSGTFDRFDALTNVITDVMSDDDNETDTALGYREETRRSKCMTRVMAFVAGVFHGIAGPGGVLGVMVALKLDSWIWSSLYMFIFFISSICTMGVYAVVYGFATTRMTMCADNKQVCAFYLKFVSALFSIVVGVLWLTLTFTGTLDKIFD